MEVQITLPDTDAPVAFVIARVTEPSRCPVLGRTLQDAVRSLMGGMHVVLVHRDAKGEIRAFGRDDLVAAAVRVDLDRQPWVAFEVDECPRGARGPSAVARLAA